MDGFLADIRHVMRGIARNPGYALFTVLVFALAVGTVTPTFSLVDTFLFRPLPFGEPGRLVHVWGTDEEVRSRSARVSVPDYLDWRRETKAFSGLVAFNYSGEDLTDGDRPEEVASGRVSANFLDVLERKPLIGRGFSEGEDEPGAAPVAILSEQLWRERYGGDPGILGRTIGIDGTAHTVVGVMPADFLFPLPITRIWIPRMMDTDLYPRGRRLVQVAGRLAPGVTPKQAQDEMTRIAAGIAEQYPDTHRYWGARVTSLRAALNFADEIISMMSLVLAAAHVLVLGIVCANLSGLFLSRAMRRSRELSIRLALGGSRRRIVRLILLEPVVLASISVIPGLALAAVLCRTLDSLIPPDIYRVGSMDLDLIAVGFTIGLSVATACAASLLPAIKMSRVELADVLRATSLATTTSRERSRLQSALVVVEVALGVTLLVAALLMARTVDELAKTDVGFDSDKVLTARVSPRKDVYPDADARRAFASRVIERLEAMPGVESASAANHLPLNHEYSQSLVRMSLGDENKRESLVLVVGLRYFRTMGIELLEGREFAATDLDAGEPVVMVTRSFADSMVGPNALGRTIFLDDDEVRIIGIVRDSAHASLEETTMPIAYLSQLQSPTSYYRFLVRAEQPTLFADAIREVVQSIDPEMPVTEVRTLDAVISEFVLPRRVMSVSLTGLSVGALLLAAIGLYGLIAFFVAQQTREIGVRLALGAGPSGILRMVVMRALRLATYGVAAGIVGSLALTRLMSGLLPGTARLDAFILVAVALIILAMTIIATASPALRASQLHPSDVLRAE